MFSKRHYKFIAEMLMHQKPVIHGDATLFPQGYYEDVRAFKEWAEIVIEFADSLEKDNPKFNRIKFLDAAGYMTF